MRELLVLIVAAAAVVGDDLPPSCERPVYCKSQLLQQVQLARIFPDSKTFVDLPLKSDENTTLAAFDQLLNETNGKPSRDQISDFVKQYFDEDADGELSAWTPPDFQEEPKFLSKIRDATLRQFAKDIHNITRQLGRKVRDEVFEKPDLFSLVPVSHGFIVPGGRFKELYYWDAYWIIEGLLICDMNETAKGMIQNLIELLMKFGKIPNGSRWYYQERSQPPLLAAMMSIYYDKTKDKDFLEQYADSLENEMNYWLDKQAVSFTKDDKVYTLLRYYAPSSGPRPESFYEDYEDAKNLTSGNQTEFYIDIKSGAESGWDFSTRWFITPEGDNNGTLINIKTRDIIPVDLNAIFANALDTLARFYCILKNPRKAAKWGLKAEEWKRNLDKVLWNEKDGIWYDYDILNEKQRQYFYPSNIAPFWTNVVTKGSSKSRASKAYNYLVQSKGLDFPGGIPASLIRSGQQWDFPNAWPPLVSIVVNALENMKSDKSRKLAFQIAQDWVRINYKGYKDNRIMSEKYDAENPGEFGGGGEYVVQAGFGWTNGVVLEFLNKYGDKMSLNQSEEDDRMAENRARRSLDHLSLVSVLLGGNMMSWS